MFGVDEVKRGMYLGRWGSEWEEIIDAEGW